MRLMTKRLIISSVVLIGLITLTVFYFSHYYTNSFTNSITYNQKENIDYEVCLKQNNYFSEKCLASNKTYVADIIDYINLDYSYSLNASERLKQTYTYNVTTEVVATSKEDSSKIIYDKKDVLIQDTKAKNTGNAANISKSITLNYNDYSGLITNFKKDYVLALDAKLIVTMNINYSGFYDNNFDKVTDSKALTVVIPLSEQTVAITTNNNKETTYKTIYKHMDRTIMTKLLFTLLVILDALVFTYLLYVLLKLRPAKREYLRELDRILKEYDRAIVNVNELPDVSNRNVIKVSTFDELLDARDNLEKPILFYKYVRKDKSVFTIINETEAYIFTLEINKDR